MSLRACKLFLIALTVAAGNGVGSADTEATPADLLWHARVNPKAMDEALAAGVLQITDNGTVALARFVAAPVSSGYERVKKHREGKRQSTDHDSSPEPVAAVAAEPPQPEPAPEPITTTSEAAIVPPPPSPPEPTIDASVILPDGLLPAEIRSVGLIVGDLPADKQQEVVDELAGNMEDGSVRTSKLGMLRKFAGLARIGNFAPEKGIMIAARRAAVARSADQVQACQQIARQEKPVDVQAMIIATARKNKGMADIFARMQEALNDNAA
ncbi:hypothetical protein [Candidatus Magnetaquicoccus inordinatus]|uniref:hypothetical protein n=1 Tax=Candidatus Magnetaquicoccus inordinatus TaxID=2496818 RepID=UPI00102AEAC3|nr:hypothetical protein [Candidatus Magnetaquicoccus inordinatus]